MILKNNNIKILVTGGAGYIGSHTCIALIEAGYEVVVVDNLSNSSEESIKRIQALTKKRIIFYQIDVGDKSSLKQVFNENSIDAVIHFAGFKAVGESVMKPIQYYSNNVSSSINLFDVMKQFNCKFLVFSSSATVYGDPVKVPIKEDFALSAKNPYGRSKHDFDLWVLKQEKSPPFWAGLKFFNIYGPNEYHKGRMSSVVLHAFNQIREKKQLKLFRSHNADYKDGMQLRDFCYVKDLLKVSYYFMKNQKRSGIYNLGTGKARAFLDLGKQVFKSMEVPERIQFIDTPLDIREKYQYFTQASLTKLRSVGYQDEFTSLEDGVHDYISDFLKKEKYF